ncbi:MAG: hypothetical protein J6F30_05400 [Cellulosilyticum sp.]|nr:hypothetical protein [Cellulosilyticum sp.]
MKKANGFTLLEMCLCFILFAIFIEWVGTYYVHVSNNSKILHEQIELMNESDNIEAFLHESIRNATQLRIITEGAIIESSHKEDVISGELVKMEFIRATNKKETSNDEVCCVEISNNVRATEAKGKHNLIYKVEGKGGHKVISDQVETIKVTSYANSNIVTFECTLHKEGETNSRLIYKKVFSESLDYKGHITT